MTVSYDGTNYVGWQRQKNGLSVQQVLEEALEKLLGGPVRVTGASRTDAGVHALGQRAHLDSATGIPAEKLPFALNTMLPGDVRVLQGLRVPDSLHARFSVSGKTYRYQIHNSPHASALYRNLSAHVPVRLDDRRMDEACRVLLGTHDFAAFAAAGGSAKTTVRTITEIRVERTGEEVFLTVSGNAFLYNMVRIIAGTLIDIGRREGKNMYYSLNWEKLRKMSRCLQLMWMAPKHTEKGRAQKNAIDAKNAEGAENTPCC